MNDPLKEEIAGLYEFGFNTNELAEMYGKGKTTIRAWIKEAGVELREKGRPVSQSDKDEIIKLREVNKWTWDRIGERFDLTRHGARMRYLRAKREQ